MFASIRRRPRADVTPSAFACSICSSCQSHFAARGLQVLDAFLFRQTLLLDLIPLTVWANPKVVPSFGRIMLKRSPARLDGFGKRRVERIAVDAARHFVAFLRPLLDDFPKDVVKFLSIPPYMIEKDVEFLDGITNGLEFADEFVRRGFDGIGQVARNLRASWHVEQRVERGNAAIMHIAGGSLRIVGSWQTEKDPRAARFQEDKNLATLLLRDLPQSKPVHRLVDLSPGFFRPLRTFVRPGGKPGIFEHRLHVVVTDQFAQARRRETRLMEFLVDRSLGIQDSCRAENGWDIPGPSSRHIRPGRRS